MKQGKSAQFGTMRKKKGVFQCQPINIEIFNKSNDRFSIIDKDVYLIGMSLKDIVTKIFGFTKMNIGKEKTC